MIPKRNIQIDFMSIFSELLIVEISYIIYFVLALIK